MSGDWQTALVASLRAAARDARAESFRLEALADKIESPPEGVRVEYAGRDAVRFVGPTVPVAAGAGTPGGETT